MPFSSESRELAPEVISLAQTLASIPSPTGFETEKAQFIRQWLMQRGIQSDLDEAGNVVLFLPGEPGDKTQLYLAHIDTVFGNVDKIVPKTEGSTIYAPSIGDNSCNVAALLVTLEAFVQSRRKLKYNRIIAFNVGEEGLGNLCGVRAMMQRYGDRIDEVIAIDATSDAIVSTAVGSIRYRVEVKTRGGHSYSAFGNPSAIRHAAHIVEQIYGINVPKHPKTTYNVGMIEGGTSVNTIAQRCSMLLDLRSEELQCLQTLNNSVLAILNQKRNDDVTIDTVLLGERPCGIPIDDTRLVDRINAIRCSLGLPVQCTSGSTDCNLPLSLGIPSVCLGVYRGQGAHTMEESIDAGSVPLGLRQLLMLFFDETFSV